MNKDKATSIIFFIVGTLLLIPTIFLPYRSYKIITTYEKVTGVLVGFKDQWQKDEKTGEETLMYAPIYQYKDKKGKSYQVSSDEYSSSMAYSSTETKIYYDKKYPYIAVTGIFQLYIVPCISIFFCTLCLFTAYVVRLPTRTQF